MAKQSLYKTRGSRRGAGAYAPPPTPPPRNNLENYGGKKPVYQLGADYMEIFSPVEIPHVITKMFQL